MTDKASSNGHVILVGAGPGDVGLLTLKGKDWLSRADVIVYDHLINRSMMRFAHDDAERIYVGKKEGHATLAQNEINALLVEKARQGKTVVRLKGGDPFIFGRGGEETQALKSAGIRFTVVPGIPSPVGVSAYAGIPLTHRDHSSTLSIITGSNESGQDDIKIDWEKIAARSGTLVFLMGARKLPRIVEQLTKFGKHPGTPVAVIQWGTTARQRTWTGTLGTIVDIATKEKIKPPTLTIIGEVVNLKSVTDWYETLPLFGKTVVITRAEEQSGSFIHMLEERGAEPFLHPTIQTAPPDDWSPLDQALERLDRYDGLIFTSVNGVRFFTQRLREKDKDIRELKGVRIYAIGPKTAQAVHDLNVRVDTVPEDFVAESLIESLGRESVEGKKFLLPRAAVAREILPETLREMGAAIDVVPAYQTVPPAHPDPEFLKRLEEGSIDVITFTSSSTVNNFMDRLGKEQKARLGQATIACIGPVTQKTAEDRGLKVAIVPDQFTVDALVEAIEKFYEKL
ncbi:HemD protein [Candidatus Nitromaritima sp. SCGC AAA799-C22]|nr:HemD protein [Candidatus Nitromaritima sp. SCGC AAA799-C22]